MVKIQIKGDIVDNVTAKFYDWFDISCCAPEKVSHLLDSAEKNESVDLEIASNGGDVFAASEIYTMLRQYNGKVNVVIQGLAASAASIIAMAGDHVSIAPTGQIMIHRAWTTISGNTEALDHASVFLEGTDQAICNAYELKTQLPRDQIIQMMGNETWLNAQEAVDKGFADEILFMDTTKSTTMNAYTSIPSKQAINQFLTLLAKSENKEKSQVNKKQNNFNDSHPTDSLQSRKLAILFEKKEGDVH
ncbi:Clp protease ClpP [Enterococcus hirae]|nr:Clp protease ClpP [Enterococcus hirae]